MNRVRSLTVDTTPFPALARIGNPASAGSPSGPWGDASESAIQVPGKRSTATLDSIPAGWNTRESSSAGNGRPVAPSATMERTL